MPVLLVAELTPGRSALVSSASGKDYRRSGASVAARGKLA
jgi:hypothetical protein